MGVNSFQCPSETTSTAPSDHFDGGLIVNRVPRHRHAGGPFFCVGHGIVRHVLVIQVRKHRKINQSQRFIATGGRLPADEVLPDVGGHHHAPGAQSHIDRLAQRRQEVRQSGLPHPVAQIQGIAATHQQDVGLLDHGDPKLLVDAGQRGELQHSQGLPTQFAHGGSGFSSADEPPCMAGTVGIGVHRGGNAEGAGLGNRFAQ